MRSFGVKACFAVLALSLALAGQAWALEKLPDMSVTATGSEQSLEKLARNVTVISRQEIEAMNPLTVTDLLKAVPGVTVRDYTGTGALATVDMRGFGESAGQHVAVLVDGRRINQLDMAGVDFTTIPVENIERIEILHGPGSVLYGDNAVGGVINIITRQGQGPPSGQLSADYGSYERWGARGNVGGSTDKLSYFITARNESVDGYRENSETRLKNATFSTAYQATPALGFVLDGGVSQSNYSLPGSLTAAQMEADRRQSVNQNQWAENKDWNVRGQMKWDLGAAGRFSADLSFRQRKADSQYYSSQSTDIQVWGLQPKHVWDANLGGMGSRLTLGVDMFKWNMTNDSGLIGGAVTESDDYKLTTIAPYALEELSLTDKLTLSAGARWQSADYDIDLKPVGMDSASQDYSDGQLAWTLGLAYAFLPSSKVYARAGRTFRYPAIDEYVTYGQFAQLDPEYGMNYEVGAEYSFMPGGRVSLALYWLELNDEIAYNSETYMNENLDATKHQGLEASVVAPIGAWTRVFANLTYENAEFTDGPYDGNEIPLVPELSGAAGFTVEPGCGFSGTMLFRYVGERRFGSDYYGDYDKMDDYVTLDLYLSYTWQKKIKVYLNATNLLGEKYSTYGYAGSWGEAYYPDPEAQVWGGVAYNF